MTSFLKNPAFLVGLLAVIALLAIVIIAIAVILLLRSRKKGEQSEPEEIKTERPRIWFPASGMTGSFREAMRRLKERLPGWDYRYEAPWFVLVGESGSGKTTVANEFSGTSIETIEPLSIDCAPRWLLLDRAVLIDLPGKAFLSSEQPTNAPESTAPSFLGRVVPPAHELSDRDAWRSFLRATARYRPRQPLNGIVLTISAVKLLDIEADPDHQRNLAWIANLSDRLQDIQHLIGLSVPVYVLVTKCDVVNGFGFYSRRFIEDALSLRAEEDGGAGTEIGDDLFGWSNPHLLDSTFSPAWVDEAFDATTDALLRHQMKMLAESRTVAAADGVFVFPFELQRLQVPLRTLMNVLFRETAYHSPHLLRGIYFCGRESDAVTETAATAGSPSSARLAPSGFLQRNSNRIVFVRDLFEYKVFAERYLATQLTRGFFSSNRSVLGAQITACVLGLLLLIGLIHDWSRLGSLQTDHIDPVLQSIAAGLDGMMIGPSANVAPAADLLDGLGAAHENEFYSLAFPSSYLDLDGLHRNLRSTLERTFEIVVLRSCKYALESRISTLLTTGAEPSSFATHPLSASPAGNGWTVDPSYRKLETYLSQVKALRTNIARYNLISGAGSGSFTQLNELLHYLGSQDLPDSSRLAKDAKYQKLLLDATWQPLQIPSNFDHTAAAVTYQLVTNFYSSWFDSNPLIGEVQSLAGTDGLQALISPGKTPSDDQLHGIVGQAQSIDNQLSGGAFDWLAGSFNREGYPALGAELDEMPFADDQYDEVITGLGTQKLEALKTALKTNPQILDFSDGKVRLSGQVHTLASVLDALLGYELMTAGSESAASESCELVPSGAVWNQAELNSALKLDAARSKIETELLPEVPGEYRDAVRQIVNGRTVNEISAVLQRAAVTESDQSDKQTAFDTQLQNLSQSADMLKQLGSSLTALHATAEASCLNRSVTRQASALLVQVNNQLMSLYSHGSVLDNSSHPPPVSQLLYGTASADDLQAYLSTQRQQVESLASDAAPLLQLLHSEGGHSDVLRSWRTISQDVAALEAKKPGNSIQALETYISTGLDKITPEAECKANTLPHSTDVFLNIRAELTQIAVTHCQRVALSRFNEIAAAFNSSVAGHFPFSQVLDTRPDAEADPKKIAEFYQTVDRDGLGLINVLPDVADKPADAVTFLQAVADVRPLVSGTAKDPDPVLGVTVDFRTNRNHEVFGDRIAAWTLSLARQTVGSQATSPDAPPLIWQFGDPVSLTLRYANNSPQLPATPNPSPAARVAGGTVTYTYTDAWSLFALLRDHPPGSTDPQNQYELQIPNTLGAAPADTAKPPQTVVYLEVNLLPAGAKTGSATLPVPSFPYKAPLATLKSASGE